MSDMDEYDMVDKLAELSKLPVPKSLADLKNRERRLTGSIERTDMADFVMGELGIK